MEVNGKAFGEDFSGKMGDSIRTEIGTLVINFTNIGMIHSWALPYVIER